MSLYSGSAVLLRYTQHNKTCYFAYRNKQNCISSNFGTVLKDVRIQSGREGKAPACRSALQVGPILGLRGQVPAFPSRSMVMNDVRIYRDVKEKRRHAGAQSKGEPNFVAVGYREECPAGVYDGGNGIGHC